MLNRSQKRALEFVALLLILVLAAYLRLTHLADNPGWYTDEATHINIAHNLAQGRVQYLAVNQSMLMFARPPLFHLILAGLFRLFGVQIIVLRTFTALLGVLSVGLVYVVLRRMMRDQMLPLLAVLMLAMYPQAVLYSRFGFSYNLLVPLILLLLLSLWHYWEQGRRGWLALGALAVGTGMLIDLLAFSFAPVVLLIVLARRWRDSLWSIPLLLTPFALYAALMLLSVPEAFLFDLGFTFGRLQSNSLVDQIGNIANNYTVLISQDFWMLAGILGLFLLRPLRLRWLALMLFWLPVIIMGRTAALYHLSFYYMIPLLPLGALGMAALLRYGVPHAYRTTHKLMDTLLLEAAESRLQKWLPAMRITGAAGAVVLIIASPLVTTLVLTHEQVQTHWDTTIEPFLITPEDARQVAAFIEENTTANDLVIASPPVGWQFVNPQTADFQMAISYIGEDTPHVPGYTPLDRYAFDPRYERARYVVVDNLWRNWGAMIIPRALAMLHEVERWPLVMEAGSIQVYANPEIEPSP